MKDLRFLGVFISYLILVLLTLAVLDFFLTPRIRDIITQGIEQQMAGTAKALALMPGDDLEPRVRDIAETLGMRLTLIDPSGRVIADSEADARAMENHLNRPEIEQARASGQGRATRRSGTLRESMLYVALPVKEQDEIKGYIRLAHPLRNVPESLDRLYQAIYLTMYVIAIPSLLLAYVFSRKIGARLNR
ncbi:MAG: sensory histidine kinase CreC [Syntrophaceae bacterium PtaU1.Bin231]|nr:MAG: sensory histidine kinase CreC [Syntrophaceae bacterium PtaU1.Bin231]